MNLSTPMLVAALSSQPLVAEPVPNVLPSYDTEESTRPFEDNLDLSILPSEGIATVTTKTDWIDTQGTNTLAEQLTFEEVFRRRVQAWKSRTPSSSSNVSKMFQRPEYRAIVGLGHEAIPLILEELQREPDFWFTALQELTGAQPVPESSFGKLGEMREAWLKWGKEHGYTK